MPTDPTLVQAAAGAAPGLDPATYMGAAASASTPAQSAGNAQATAQYGNVSTMATALNGYSVKQQRTVWDAQTPSMQAQLKAVGYKPPADPAEMSKPGRGILGGIGHVFGMALSGAGSALQKVGGTVAHAAGDVLNAAASPLRFTQHLGRAIYYGVDESEMNNEHGVSGLIGKWGFFNPQAWVDEWNATTNGASTFDPRVLRSLGKKYDPATLQLAKQVASGIPEQHLVDSVPQAKQLSMVQQLQQPEFKQLVSQLTNAHITFGQSVVGQTLGENFLNEHPTLGHAVSGAMDATFDWYGDPANKPLQYLAVANRARYSYDAAKAASYMASDGAEADALNGAHAAYLAEGPGATAGFNRAIQRAGQMLAKGQGTGFRTAFPRSIGPVYDQLVREGVDSPEKLADWFSSQAGMKAILEGRAARSAAGGARVLPHLSPVGWAVAPLRAALRTSLDKLIDDPHPLSGIPLSQDMLLGAQGPLHELAPAQDLERSISTAVRGGVSKVARLGRRIGTLTPTGVGISLTDPNGFEPLRRTLLYSLPVKTVDDIGQIWGEASPAVRRQILVASKAQMLYYAGAFANDPDPAARIVETMQRGYKQEAYAGGKVDQFANGERHGLLETQMDERQSLPDLHSVHQEARAGNFLARMGLPDVGATRAASAAWNAATRTAWTLMGLWRPSVLAREGFPLRIAIDENGNYILRNGGMEALKARVALHQYKGDIEGLDKARTAAEAAEKGLEPEAAKFARTTALFAHAVPAPILNAARSMKDIGSSVIAENAWKVLGGMGQGLSREDYYKAADALTDRWDVAGPAVLAIHHAGGGYDEAEHLENLARAGHSPIPVRWRDTKGGFADATRDDPLFHLKWGKALDIYGSSKLGRAALETAGMHPDTQMRRVLSVLESDDPNMEKLRELSPRDYTLPDNRQVGIDAGVDTAAAHRAWARKIVAATNNLVTGASGTLHQNIIDEMLAKHGAPSMDTLREIEDLPKGVFGPDFVPATGLHRVGARAMNFFARQMDWLARQPNMLHATATNMREIEPMVTRLQGDGEHAKQLLGDLAVQRGIGELKPFIHNPELKTQFEVFHRTAAPFLFAQHQFLQRWGRTFLDSPDAIRKASLMLNGLQTSGFLHKDSQGNWFFNYPLTGAGAAVVSHVLDHLGFQSSIGTDVPFTGDLKYIMPGLSNPLTPSAGPVMSIPLKFIAGIEPAFNGVEQAVLQQGASQTYWEQVLPSTVSRVINGIIGDQQAGTAYASMMIKAIQDAEASGYSLEDVARTNGHVVNGVPVPTSKDTQEYLDRIRNWARVNTFLTAAIGFVVPASPSQNFDTHNLDARLQTLLNELPYNTAITEYLKENPNATPWTVSKSQVTGGGVLPASQAAGEFIDSNSQFMQDHQYAAGWFIPRTTGNQPFNAAVYREQIQYGLRSEKTPASFLNDVAIAPASQAYYQVYDAKEAAIAADPNNTTFKQQINSRFDQWRGQFLALNPLFADALNGSQSGARRQATIADINGALEDANVPESAQTTHIANVAAVYNAWEQEFVQLEGNNTAAAYDQKKALETAVTNWGNQYAANNADVSDLWSVVYLPEIRSITASIDYPVNPVNVGTGG